MILHYRCDDGVCLDEKDLCDGVVHCRDASDEERCESAPCSPSEFECRDGSSCVPERFLCDGTTQVGRSVILNFNERDSFYNFAKQELLNFVLAFLVTTAHKKEHCYDLRCLLIGRKKNLANEKTERFITMLFFVGLGCNSCLTHKSTLLSSSRS